MKHSKNLKLVASCLSLLFISDAVMAQFYPGYYVRQSTSLSSSIVGSTYDTCELTGRQSGVSREARCVGSNGQSYTGWVNRMGVSGTAQVVQAQPQAQAAPVQAASVAQQAQASSGQTNQQVINPVASSAQGGWTQAIAQGSSMRHQSVTPVRASAQPAQAQQAAATVTAAAASQTVTTAAAGSTQSRRATPAVGPTVSGSQFIELIREVTPERIRHTRAVSARRPSQRVAVDVVRMPEVQVAGDNLGSPLCGTYRARDRSPLYFTAQAACLMTSVAQKWRQNFCPDNAPDCRLVIGDASHGQSLPSNWPHASHRDGRCVDIYLPRRAGAGLSDNAGNDRVFDRERTQGLVNLLVEHGGAPNSGAHGAGFVLLSQSTIRNARPWPGHQNHIHVCFPENSTNQRTCERQQFDTNLCPELAPGRQQQRPSGSGSTTVTT